MSLLFGKIINGYSIFIHKILITTLLLISSLDLFSQIVIKGVVSDEKKQPLTGVTVIIKGKQIGAITDIDGNYSLLASSTDVIQFSAYGYNTEEITVGDQTIINVKMIAEFKPINENISIGYGFSKKSNLNGSISSIKFNQLPYLASSNITQHIQGMIPGLSIISNSGEQGSGTKVRIRGISSVNNSDPLYIVDGFPINNIDFISPADIESIEVLKDASSTAIYGMKGANGALLITTKKGTADKTTVRFNAEAGLLKLYKKIDVLNASEYANAKLLAYDNDSIVEKWRYPEKNIKNSINSDFRNTLIKNLSSDNKGTDWQNEIFHNGSYKNYALEFSGGTEKLKYNATGNYFREDGILINSLFEKYLFRFSSQLEVFSFLNTDLNLSYQNTERTNYEHSQNNPGIISSALFADPISEVYLPVTDTSIKKWAPLLSKTPNPVAAAERMKNNKTKTDQFVFNLGGEIKIFHGFTFNSRYGSMLTFNRPKKFTPIYSIGENDYNDISSLDESHIKSVSWNNSNYFNFTRDIGDFNIDLTAGQEWQYADNHITRIITEGVSGENNMDYATTGTGPVKVNPMFSPDFWYNWQTSIFSYFGRCILNYNNRFLLSGTIRRDATSKVVKQYRWGNFHSLSARWNIINEDFIKHMSVMSLLSARVGWGLTGNEGSISNMYSDYSILNNSLYMIGNGNKVLNGVIPTENSNPKLRWETVKMLNAGLDFGFFRDKITGSVEYYNKYTSGMISKAQPPVFSGSRPEDATEANIGNVENKGLELTLNLKSNSKNFHYEIFSNISFLSKPTVTKLPGYPIECGTAMKAQNVIRTSEGEEMAYFYGYKTGGLMSDYDFNMKGPDLDYVYPKTDKFWFPGQIKIVDFNEDGKISDEDKTNIGSYNPDYIFGFGFNISFKGFDLQTFCYGVQGIEMINTLNTSLKFTNNGDFNLSKKILNSWTHEHTKTNAPRLVQYNQISQEYFNDYFVEDASYLRIKNIELGYTIPAELSKKAGISFFRIFVSGENLFTLTNYSGYNPEVGNPQISAESILDPLTQGLDDATYPIAKKYIVGLNITF